MSVPPGIRVALYWAPALDDPLTEAGNAWLGRDAERGVTVPQPNIAGLNDITAAPRVYGLHATLRPPMRLATGWEEFCGAVERMAASAKPFQLPRLAVADAGGFLALRETAPCPALHGLADDCVRATDPHRLAPSAAELTKRRAAGLSPDQEQLLQRWGYPYVMQAWWFHVTLTRRLDVREMAAIRPAAEAHFAAALARPRQVTELAIFTQRDNGPLLIAERMKLGCKR